MHIQLKGSNGREYIIRDTDIRRVVETPPKPHVDIGGMRYTVYFNNVKDTPILLDDTIEDFHATYLGKGFLLIIDKKGMKYCVKEKAIRRVYKDTTGTTTVCFANAKGFPLTLDISITDFNVIYLGG